MTVRCCQMPGKLKSPLFASNAGPCTTRAAGHGMPDRPVPEEIICPACLRIHDKNPKGFVTLKGAYKTQHRDQVMGLISDTEAQKRCLARMVTIEDRAEGLVVLTTDAHLHGAWAKR